MKTIAGRGRCQEFLTNLLKRAGESAGDEAKYTDIAQTNNPAICNGALQEQMARMGPAFWGNLPGAPPDPYAVSRYEFNMNNTIYGGSSGQSGNAPDSYDVFYGDIYSSSVTIYAGAAFVQTNLPQNPQGGLPCPNGQVPLKDRALNPAKAMTHFTRGSGTPLHMPIDDMLGQFPSPTSFRDIQNLIQKGPVDQPFVTVNINGAQSTPVQLPGDQGAFLGRVTFNLKGILNVYMTGDYQFYGSIGVNPDPFDFHPSSGPHKRGLGYELSAKIGGLASGKPFDIIIDGRYKVALEGKANQVSIIQCTK